MSGLEQLFVETLSQRSLLVVVLAFAGGVVSSLLPCTVAMLPVLVGYVGGYNRQSMAGVLQQIVLFMLGVATVMTALGIAASLAGVVFGSFTGSGWYYVVGAVAIIMGLHLLGVVQVPLPRFITQMPETEAGKLAAPFILGLAFGAASSPCGTPFLTAILGFISHEKNLVLGGASLFTYALGQTVLLLVVGIFTGLLKHMATLRSVGRVINVLSAIVFLLAGLLFIAQGAGWLDPLAFY